MIKIQHVFLGFLVVVASAFVFLMKRSLQVQKDETVLVVGTSSDYPPYEFKDIKTDQIVGFDIDVISEVARRLNKKMVIKDMPFTSLIFGLLSGDIDVIAAGMTPSFRRGKFVLFTDKYLDSDSFAVVTLKKYFNPQSLSDLHGKLVIVNTGHTAESYMAKQEGINLVHRKTVADSLIALQSRSADAFVCAQSVAKTMISKIAKKDDLAILVLPNTGDDCAFALNKSSDALTQNINMVLKIMREDGTLEQLKIKWNLL